MGNITFLAAEVLFLGAMVYIAPFFCVIFTALFFLGALYFWFGERKILYFAVPVIFLMRIFLTVNFDDVDKIKSDELKKIQTKIVNSRGRITKIDNGIPLEMINIYVPKISDGKYVLYGTMERLRENFNYFSVEVLEKEELKSKKIEIFFDEKLKKMRKYISNRCGNLLQGVILGERGYIYKKVRNKFIYCGSAHLLAISGLHIGAVIGLILKCVKILKLRKEAKYTLAFMALTVYVLGISRSPSVLRAYIMGGVFLAGKIFYERGELKKSLSTAVIINLFLFPNSLGDISFILSYLCLFTIIYIYPKCRLKIVSQDEKGSRKILKNKKIREILNFLIFTGVIQIFMVPVSICFFNTIPMLSYFTNFFITPVGMCFVSLGFIGFFVPEIIFKSIFAPILEILYKILEFMLDRASQIPYLTIGAGNKLSLKFMIFLYIILISLFYYREILKYFMKRNRAERREKKRFWESR